MNSMAQTIRSLGAIKLGAMAVAAIVLISLFAFIALRISSPMMAPLYNGLSMKDSAAIVSELEKQSIPYELRGDGSQILVPSDQQLRLRMKMAEQGLPNGGSLVGYEIFDKTDAMGTSNFVMNVNMARALEGELSRTIGAFNNLESARVHLVMPKRELFTRDKAEPTASVVITPRGAVGLSKSEVAAIQHLVATAVPGLKASKVTIVDSKGNMLARGVGEGEEDSSFSSDAEEYRRAYERRMRTAIEELLSKALGAGEVQAEVTADINFDRIVTKSEKYDPESQVARSIQESSEQENSKDKSASDTVSVANNLPDANKDGAGGNESTRNLNKTDSTTNFEISKEVKNQISESGKVNKLSIAVMVDGTYKVDNGQQVYTPRSADELKQIATLVKSAVGFDKKRGDTVEVVNMQFSDIPDLPLEEGPMAWLKQELQSIVQTLVIGGVAVLAILLVIRPLVTRAIEASRTIPELDEEAQVAALGGPSLMPQLQDQRFESEEEEELINIDRVSGRVKSATFRKVIEIIDKHPEEAMGVVRQWMMAS